MHGDPSVVFASVTMVIDWFQLLDVQFVQFH